MARPITILMAEDDDDDRTLTREALEASRLANDVRFVEDGVELLDYLNHRGEYEAPGTAPRPGLILLDLYMPRKTGLEALAEIKETADLRRIPVVVLSVSSEERDLKEAYRLGASSYVTKPVTFDGLVRLLRSLAGYWFQIVTLPESETEH